MSNEAEPQRPKRKYRRARLKKQVTVRIDENLIKAAQVRLEAEGLRFTDAVEEGLWLWVQQKHRTGASLRGRFLWSKIPLETRELTLDLWASLIDEEHLGMTKVLFHHIPRFLKAYRDSYPERRQKYLEKLGAPAQQGDS